MIVLADNDIILKLAQCDLLEVIPDSLGQEWTEVFITDTAKYQLLPKNPAKALSKCGNEETLARLTAFLETTQTLPAVNDTALLAQLEDINDIDGGEKFLLLGFAAYDLPGEVKPGFSIAIRVIADCREFQIQRLGSANAGTRYAPHDSPIDDVNLVRQRAPVDAFLRLLIITIS